MVLQQSETELDIISCTCNKKHDDQLSGDSRRKRPDSRKQHVLQTERC